MTAFEIMNPLIHAFLHGAEFLLLCFGGLLLLLKK